MKLFNLAASAGLALVISPVIAENVDVEMSSLVQWEETQSGEMSVVSNEDIINKINQLEATAAGKQEHSSLVQWEETQYAKPYSLKEYALDESGDTLIKKINQLESTQAGVSSNDMSSLIQWEESF